MYTVKQYIVLKLFYSRPFLGCSVQKRISIHASSQWRFCWSLVCQLWLFYRNVGCRGGGKKGGERPWRSAHRDNPSHAAHTHLQTSWGGVHHNDSAKAPIRNWGDALVNQLSSRLCSLFFGSWNHSRKYCTINKVCALAGIVNGTASEASITISRGCEHFYFGNAFVMWVTLHIRSYAWRSW